MLREAETELQEDIEERGSRRVGGGGGGERDAVCEWRAGAGETD